MSMTRFMVTALSSALELGIGTADDVLAHVTPDVLSQHLPRPLWARLITACLGASKVNAQLVVDTIGMTNLCEHMPGSVMWAVLADIGARALGKEKDRGAVVAAPIVTPPPAAAREETAPTPTPASGRSRSPSRQPPFGRGIPPAASSSAGASSRGGALSGNQGGRRPQANAPAATPAGTITPAPASALVGPRVTPQSPRRGATSSDFDIDTDVRALPVGKEVEVDDEQLVDWSSAEETVTSTEYERKR